LPARESVPCHHKGTPGQRGGINVDIADMVTGLLATGAQRRKESAHRIVANSREFRTVVDVRGRGEQTNQIVDATVVDEHAIVTMQSCDAFPQRVVRCVVSASQFAPLRPAQYANERLVGEYHDRCNH